METRLVIRGRRVSDTAMDFTRCSSENVFVRKRKRKGRLHECDEIGRRDACQLCCGSRTKYRVAEHTWVPSED